MEVKYKHAMAVFALALAALLVAPSAFAESDGPRIKTLFVVGAGLAINTADDSDIRKLEIAVGEIERIDGNVFGRGLIKLDGEKFQLAQAKLDGNVATANIVKLDGNTVSTIGSLSLTRVEKPGKDIWKGRLDINGEGTFNIYIIGHARKFKSVELGEDAKRYCDRNSSDSACQKISDIPCGDANEIRCRERVVEYCKNNPNAPQCKFLAHRLCVLNHNEDKDVRCRFLAGDSEVRIEIRERIEKHREDIRDRIEDRRKDRNGSDENESDESDDDSNQREDVNLDVNAGVSVGV